MPDRPIPAFRRRLTALSADFIPMMHFDYRLRYILVGASGSGKTTMGHVLEDTLGLRRCITSTTRPMRPGEVEGRDYYFRDALDPKELFEHASFGGNEYGISFDELARGDFVILEPQGVRYFREHYPAPLTVIQLQRSNIQVDKARRGRDKAAGFEDICPDIVVCGETIDAMATNLLNAISPLEGRRPGLAEQIRSAQIQASSPGMLRSQQEKEFAR